MNAFLAFLLGAAIGWFALKAIIMLKVKRMLDSIANEPTQQLPVMSKPVKIVNIDLVRMDHAVLAYDRDSQQFLAQGQTKEEIVDILRKRFPDTSFMASPKNLKEVDLQ